MLFETRIFQSTRPLRGATVLLEELRPELGISIHAPLAGRDAVPSYSRSSRALFQSTRPLRGATDLRPDARAWVGISIHAPLAGRDRGCFPLVQ